MNEHIKKLNEKEKIQFYLDHLDILMEEGEPYDRDKRLEQRLDPTKEPIETQDITHFCNRCICEMVVDEKGSVVVCNQCGICKPVFIFYQDYKDMSFERTGYAYKRITHFRHHFRKLQCKIKGSIVYLSGRLEAMFNSIQSPYLRHKPENRRNFFSYSYILKKFFEILNLPDISAHLTYLKSKEKLKAHDAIWENICAEKGWDFIPSKRRVEHKRIYKKRRSVKHNLKK